MPHLFDPLTIKSVTLRNRIGVSPMCQYSSENGHATDWHFVHLVTRAIGGAGLVIAEATGVTPAGRITPGCAGLWQDSQIAPLAKINAAIKQYGAVPGIQLAHAGRKASAARPWDGGRHLGNADGGWDIIGPSDEAFGGVLNKKPSALDAQGIADIVASFRDAARRAVEAGYEWLEIHAAHGYLLHSFLSPLTNTRNDEYGGSLENRARALLEVIAAVKEVWPEDLPLTVRLSASDWVPGGWQIEDSVALTRILQRAGIDLIDCSSGGNRPHDAKHYPAGPGYQVPLAEEIRAQTGMLTAAVGLITDFDQADKIIRTGQADLVLLGREVLRNPYWPAYAAKALGVRDALDLPVQYERAG